MFDLFYSIFDKIDLSITTFLKTAASIEYRLPTIITIVVLTAKFFVNKSVCALDFKKLGVELPCEVITLSLGFVIIAINSTNTKIKEILFTTFVLIFLLIVIAALVNYLQRENVIDKISPFTKEFWMCISCYIIAIFSFYFSMSAAMK